MWRNFPPVAVSAGPLLSAFVFGIATGNIARGILCRNRPMLPRRGGGFAPIIAVLPATIPEARGGDVCPRTGSLVVILPPALRKGWVLCRRSDSPISEFDPGRAYILTIGGRGLAGGALFSRGGGCSNVGLSLITGISWSQGIIVLIVSVPGGTMAFEFSRMYSRSRCRKSSTVPSLDIKCSSKSRVSSARFNF
jgi:hypothetical protein